MPLPGFRLRLDTAVTIHSSVVLLSPGRFVEFLIYIYIYEGDGDPQGNVLAHVVSAQQLSSQGTWTTIKMLGMADGDLQRWCQYGAGRDILDREPSIGVQLRSGAART